MKKQTKAQKAKAYIQENWTAKPATVAHIFKLSLPQVYNLRAQVKKLRSKPASTPTNNTENGSVLAVQKRQIDALQQQVTQLNSWNAQWEVRCNATDKELTECKIAYLDATAIIRYLERKIADLVEMKDK